MENPGQLVLKPSELSEKLPGFEIKPAESEGGAPEVFCNGKRVRSEKDIVHERKQKEREIRRKKLKDTRKGQRMAKRLTSEANQAAAIWKYVRTAKVININHLRAILKLSKDNCEADYVMPNKWQMIQGYLLAVMQPSEYEMLKLIMTKDDHWKKYVVEDRYCCGDLGCYKA